MGTRLSLALGILALAGTAPATAAERFGEGPPAYVVYPAPDDVPNAANAAEPSIGVNFRTGAVLFQAFASTHRIAFDDRTIPAGVLWEDAQNPTGSLNLDPIMFTDPLLGRTWGGGLQGPCGNLAYTDTDGPPWTEIRPCSGTIDHQTIGAGPYAAPAPAGATYPHAVYYCAQFPAQDACVVSYDGGDSFSAPVTVVGCTGLHGHVKVGPDGTAYLPNKTCNSIGTQPRAVGGGISRDNGRTWTSYAIPGAVPPGRGFDPSVGITRDNVVYQAWSRADDYHPMVARSTGLSWERMTDLAATVDPPIRASTFHSVVAGDAGRVAVAFLGDQVGETSRATTPFDNGYEGVWHLYVSTTYDGGSSWETVRISEDPVQRGCIWDGGGTNECRNLLDFMDAQMTPDGRPVVGFADGCILDCAEPDATSGTSQSALGSVARQSTGRGLLSAFDAAAAPAAPGPAPAVAPPAARAPRACLRRRARGRVVYVDGRCSSDADGPIRAYRWDWGDGTRPGRGKVTRHRYRRPGRYRIRLTVTDASGARATRAVRLRLPAPLRPKPKQFGRRDGH